MIFIEKLIIENFGKFQERTELCFNKNINILIGDNESGKTTILRALEYVVSGNRHKIDSEGLDNIINTCSVDDFMHSERKYNDLPIVTIEVYLNPQDDYEINGKNNFLGIECDGLRLQIKPNDDLSREIKKILEDENSVFPYEFYSVIFSTFQGSSYSGYKRYIKYLSIDNSSIGDEYAMRKYISDAYHSVVESSEVSIFESAYRKMKMKFANEQLNDLNNRIETYNFRLRHGRKANLENDLTIFETEVSIENRGKGRQCFIKTDFALSKYPGNLDMILLEEPENHLSHGKMNELIDRIAAYSLSQLFIATHSNEVCSRLNLKNCQLLSSNSSAILPFNVITNETADFFMKAPDNNLLYFINSKNVFLVEGHAEYILMKKFFEIVTGSTIESKQVSIISVGGLSFKRYIEISAHLGIRTAILRDNDGDHKKYCIDNYSAYISDNVQVFFSHDDNESTFERSIYESNRIFCDAFYGKGRKTLSPLEYMLHNKSEAAFQLLKNNTSITIPEYIIDGIQWISESS